MSIRLSLSVENEQAGAGREGRTGDNEEHQLTIDPATDMYPVSRKIYSVTMQNYDIIMCFPSRQALYHYVVPMVRPSKF